MKTVPEAHDDLERTALERAVVRRVLPHLYSTAEWLSEAELRVLSRVPDDRSVAVLMLAVARARAEVPDIVHIVGELDPTGPGITPLAALGSATAAAAWATAWTRAEIAAGRLRGELAAPPTEVRAVTFDPPFPVARLPHEDAIQELLAVAEQMMRESGDPEAVAAGFDVEAWLRSWLSEPCPALGGRQPSSYLGTPDGRDLIRSLLLSMQTGSFW